jgi:hypothetical protein
VRAGLPQEPHDFPGLGVTLEGFLGEDAAAIQLDFEHPARRLDQPDFCLWKHHLDLGRQTGGPGFIVSDDAELDGHAHGGNDSGA